MSNEEQDTLGEFSRVASNSGAAVPVCGDDALSLTDLIDRLDRAAFMAALEHRHGWKAADEAEPPSYEDR